MSRISSPRPFTNPTPRPSRRLRVAAGSALLTGTLLTGGLLSATTAPGGAAPIPPITLPPITVPPPSTTATWFVDADTVKVVDAQEEAIYSNGDEFYLAQVSFRSTPGQAGSTSAWYLGTPASLPNLDDGDSRSIPNAMGRVPFPSVNLRDAGEVLTGHLPEVVGSITVAFEDDGTGPGLMDSLMLDVRNAVRTEVAKVIEPLTIADLANANAVTQQLGAASKKIQEATKLTAGEKIKVVLGSFLDPDDQIDVKANVFVAVDSDLAGLVDAQLSSVPASVGRAGALRDRTYTQRFSGDSAIYDVTFHVSK